MGQILKYAEDEPLIVQMPVLIKAHLSKAGERVIEFEASSTTLDAEGDVIEQQALLNSADYFIKNGFIDVDHYCELGRNPQYHWLGIKDPDSWIVGHPVDVKDIGEYRTGVKAIIKQNKNGKVDPTLYKHDWLWTQLNNEKGEWKASVFGYPGADTEEGGCTIGTDGHVCATRYLVKSFRWHSTALTRNPINKSLKHPVQIITAKAFAKAYAAKMGYVESIPLKPIYKDTPIFTRGEVRKSYYTHMCINCPETSNGRDINTHSLRGHFIKCEQMPYFMADLYSLATMELIRRVS
jgi:hypothetical protein